MLRRTVRLKLALSPNERETLWLRAARAGLPPAVYARKAALGQPFPRTIPAVNKEAFRVLAGIGANLNQFLHHLNAGLPPSTALPDLHALLGLLLTVKRLLLGKPDELP